MKKIVAILLVMLMCVTVLVGCGGSGGSDSGEEAADYSYQWKLATTENPDYYMTVLSQEFLDTVEDRTDGKVTGEIFASGQLGGLTDMLESLEMGNVDIVMDGFSSLGEANELFDAFGMPYLYDSQDHKHKFWDLYFGECTDMLAEKANIRAVTVLDGLNRELSVKQPVENLADLKGLKIRVPTIETYVKVWEAFGAAAVPMSLSEVYTSLQTGVIDGQENDIMQTMSQNFYEICKYAVMTDHVPYEGGLFFNDEAYQQFPDELKAIIEEVGKEVMDKSREMVLEDEKTTLAKMDEMGVEIITPDLAEWKDAVQVVYDEMTYVQPVLDLIDQAR